MAQQQAEPDAPVSTVAKLRLREVRDDVVIAIIPGTDYELHLARGGEIKAAPGERIRGEIHARALRMHRADAGGNWIEPIYGMPRIVQGTVLAADPGNNRVLLDMSVPVWVTIHPQNDINQFREGELWNCYLESGTKFIPIQKI